MNDVRTAIVGFVAVVVGFVGAWLVFGAKASQLEEEIRALREERAVAAIPSPTSSPGNREEMLVGNWATTVSKSRLGRIELIFELAGDGQVVWKSVHQQEVGTIAEGDWQLQGVDIHFTVTIVDERSPEVGQQRSTVARIVELSQSCLTLEVEGDTWAFHRTTI